MRKKLEVFLWKKISLHICKEEKESERSLFLHICMTLVALGTITPSVITLKSIKIFQRAQTDV